MKNSINKQKLSHIIINVDKNTDKTPFSSFCTNVHSENDKIRFTYLSYDNRIPHHGIKLLTDLTSSGDETPGSLFIITDSETVADHAVKSGMACAAVHTKEGRSTSFPGILYCIEDIEYMTYARIERMWLHLLRLPWVITKTDRLIIREQTVDDIEDLYDICSDDEARRFTEPLYDDMEREIEYMNEYIDNQYRFFEYGIWALVQKETGRLIGRAGISLREGMDIPEIGYIIGKKYRRCGYAKEALLAIIAYGREELGIDEYLAFTKDENTASVKLLENLGFSRKGYATVMDSRHAMYILTKQQ